jgi:alpha-D-ribose 1-methylphosphonate 5-triphosphate synthase subunit PhnH
VSVRTGFADPVLDAQRAFRAVLDAMAHPGRVAVMPGVDAPPPLGTAAAAACLALLDHDTPLWIDPAGATPEVVAWLLFHPGAPIVDRPGAARFALVVDPGALDGLDAFDAGTDERPDLSATLLVQVDGLASGDGFRLRGPGIDGESRLEVVKAPAGLGAALRANTARFPRGVDLVLCAAHRLAALPRTTRVEG